MVSLILFVIIAVVLTYGNIASSQYIDMNFTFLPYISFIILSYTINIIVKKYNTLRKYFVLLFSAAVIWIGFNIYSYIEKYDTNIVQNNDIGLFNKQQCSAMFQNCNQNKPIKIGVINGFSYINNTGIYKSFYLTISSLYIKEFYFKEYPFRYRLVSVLLDTLPGTTQMENDKCLKMYYYKSLSNFLPFDVYYRNMRDEVSIDTAVLKFIKKQKLQYILLTNRHDFPQRSLPQYIRNLVKAFFVPDKMKQDTLFELKSAGNDG